MKLSCYISKHCLFLQFERFFSYFSLLETMLLNHHSYFDNFETWFFTMCFNVLLKLNFCIFFSFCSSSMYWVIIAMLCSCKVCSSRNNLFALYENACISPKLWHNFKSFANVILFLQGSFCINFTLFINTKKCLLGKML